MIIFIYGDDLQAIREARYDIISKYQNKYASGLNLLDLDLSVFSSLDSFENGLKTVSFFDEVKLIVLTNVFNSEPLSQKVLDLFNEYKVISNKEVVVMVVENQTTKEMVKINEDLYELLRKGKPVIEASERKGKELVDWVVASSKKRGSLISSSNAAYLVSKIGTNSSSIHQEIEKLSAYKRGEEVTKEDIDLLVKSPLESNIFAMVDACASEKRSEALRLLKQELDFGSSPHYILSMLAFQYRNLIFAKGLIDQKIASPTLVRRSGIKPFSLNKAKGTARYKDIASLSRAHKRLGEIDIKSKNGLLDIEDALYDFVLQM